MDNPAVTDIHWMHKAIEQAEIAAKKNEVPVGAILIDSHNKLIAAAHNSPILNCDPTAHAEINVIRQASLIVENYRLIDTTLYVTLEPCVMCVGALVHSRIKRLVFGASEFKTGAVKSQFQLLESNLHNHTIDVSYGVLEKECSKLLSDFFKQKRVEKLNA